MSEVPQDKLDLLEEELREDLKKCAVGEISVSLMEEKLEMYEAELGSERVKEIRNGKESNSSIAVDIGAFTVGILLLALKAEEKLKKISEELNFKNEAFIGKFLVARLKLEHIVNNLLIENLKESDEFVLKEIERLNFTQRIKLLPKAGKVYKKYLSLIYEINGIRNELMHNPRFDIDTVRFTKNAKLLPDNIIGDERCKLIIDLIELVSCYLLYETEELRPIKDRLLQKFPDIDL